MHVVHVLVIYNCYPETSVHSCEHRLWPRVLAADPSRTLALIVPSVPADPMNWLSPLWSKFGIAQVSLNQKVTGATLKIAMAK
jgi:hypothetical protein